MKILFFGDSITDATRERGSSDAGRVGEEYSINPKVYGSGFVFLTATQLFYEKPNYYQILNRGIGVENCCYDGTHPNLVGSKIISEEWLKVFKQEVLKDSK